MDVLGTRHRGDVAEAAILRSFAAADLLVAIPFGRFGPYDLLVETARGFSRVQVKSGRLKGGCVEFNCVGTDHGNGAGSYRGRADVFAIHVHETSEQFIVPVAEALRSKMLLRREPARNNQRRRVRLASDYALADWVARQRLPPVLADELALTAP